MALLTDDQVDTFLSEHQEWARDGDSIIRTVEYADFVEAMGFVTSVALVAEKAFHHPDIDVRWNKVTLRFSTHSEGGLTDKDIEMAARVDEFA